MEGPAADLAQDRRDLPAGLQGRGQVGQPQRPGRGHLLAARQSPGPRPAGALLDGPRRGGEVDRRPLDGEAGRPADRRARLGRPRAVPEQSAAHRGRRAAPILLVRPARPVRGDHRHKLGPRADRIRARPGVPRRHEPPGQRLPDHDAVLERAQQADARLQRRRPLHHLPGLRMVGQHRAGWRPQRHVHARGTADPSLVARPGRRPRRCVERFQQRRAALPGPEGRGLRRLRPHRRPLRRHQDGPRCADRTLSRGPFGLGHLRMARPGCAGAGLPHRHSRQFRRPQGAPWRQPSRRLAVRRLWRPVVPARHRPDARRTVRRAAPAPSLRHHRLPDGAGRARRLRLRGDALCRRSESRRRAAHARPRGHDGRHRAIARRGGGIHHRGPGVGPDRAGGNPQRPRGAGDVAALRRGRPQPARQGDLGRLGVSRARAPDHLGRRLHARRQQLRTLRADQHVEPRPEDRTDRPRRPVMDGADDRRLRRLRCLADGPARRHAAHRHAAGEVRDRRRRHRP